MCARHLPSYRSHFQFLKKGVTKISNFLPVTNCKLKVCMTQGNNISELVFEVDFARVPQLSLLRTVVLSQAAFHRNVPNVSQPCSCHTSKILQFRKATICDENLCKIRWNLQKTRWNSCLMWVAAVLVKPSAQLSPKRIMGDGGLLWNREESGYEIPSWRTKRLEKVHFRSTSWWIFSAIFLRKASLSVPKFAEIGMKPLRLAPYGRGIVCNAGIFVTWEDWNLVRKCTLCCFALFCNFCCLEFKLSNCWLLS